jgi:hypothetical protein
VLAVFIFPPPIDFTNDHQELVVCSQETICAHCFRWTHPASRSICPVITPQKTLKYNKEKGTNRTMLCDTHKSHILEFSLDYCHGDIASCSTDAGVIVQEHFILECPRNKVRIKFNGYNFNPPLLQMYK